MSDAEEIVSPYPGLRPFQLNEAHLFFGREAAVALMLERLRVHRFLAITGPSGCGKSSLVRAGLLHELDCGGLGRAHENWRMVVFRPGRNALASMAQALAATFAPELARIPHASDGTVDQELIIQARIQRSRNGLVSWLEDLGGGAQQSIFILVDQFEEVFRYEFGGTIGPVEWRNQTDRFIQSLLNAAAQTHIPIFVCLTIRLDFLGDCAHFDGLAEAISDGQFLVPRLSRSEVERAIAEPAKVFGGTVEDRLVTQLANDIAAEHRADPEAANADPDMLPLMQHVLAQLWKAATSAAPDQKPTLTLEQYQAAGGVAGALSAHLDSLYGSLTSAQQQCAEKLFKALCHSSTELRSRDVRRPITLREALQASGTDQESLNALIGTFSGEGKSFLTVQGRGDDPEAIVDISHEALIRQWGRLQNWVREEGADAKEYAALERQALAWQEGRAELLSGRAALTAAQWWARRSDTEQWAKRYGQSPELVARFVQESAAQEEQLRREHARTRRNARLFWGAAALFVALIATYMIFQSHARNQLLVQESSLVARIAEERLRAGDPVLAAALAREVLTDSAGGLAPRPYNAKAEAMLFAAMRKLGTDPLVTKGPIRAASSDPARDLFVTVSKSDQPVLELWSHRKKVAETSIPSGAGDQVELVTYPPGAHHGDYDGWVFAGGSNHLYVLRLQGLDSDSPTLSMGADYLLPKGSTRTTAIAFDPGSDWLAIAGVQENKQAILWLFRTTELRQRQKARAAATTKSGAQSVEDATTSEQMQLAPADTVTAHGDCKTDTALCNPVRVMRFVHGQTPPLLVSVSEENHGTLFHLNVGQQSTAGQAPSAGQPPKAGQPPSAGQPSVSLEPVQDFSDVSSVAISPDNRHVYTGSLKSQVTVWEVHDGKLINPEQKSLPGQAATFVMQPTSPDGTVLVAEFPDDAGYPRLYSLPSQHFWGELGSTIGYPTLVRDKGEDALLVNSESGLSLQKQDHDYDEKDFEDSADNRLFAPATGLMLFKFTANKHPRLELWNARTGQRVGTAWTPPDLPIVPYVALAPSGASAFIAFDRTDTSPGSWSCLDLTSEHSNALGTGDPANDIVGQPISVARLSADGTHVFVLANGTLSAWRCTGERLWQLSTKVSGDMLTAGNLLAITDWQDRNFSLLVRQDTGAPVAADEISQNRVIALSGDGNTLLLRGKVAGRPLEVKPLQGPPRTVGRLLPRKGASDGACATETDTAPDRTIAVSDDASAYAAILRNGSANIWVNDEPVTSTQEVFQGIDLAPKGDLATYYNNREVWIVDLKTAPKQPHKQRMPPGEEFDIKGAIAAPDGHSVLTVQYQHVMQWAPDGEQIAALPMPSCEPMSVARIPHANRVAIKCNSGELVVAEVAPLKLVQRFFPTAGPKVPNADRAAIGGEAHRLNSYWISTPNKTYDVVPAVHAQTSNLTYWSLNDSFDGARFLVFSPRGDVYLWDGDGSGPTLVSMPQAPLMYVDVLHDHLAATYDGGDLKVLTLKKATTVAPQSSVYTVSLAARAHLSGATRRADFMYDPKQLLLGPDWAVIDIANPQSPLWKLDAEKGQRLYSMESSHDGRRFGVLHDDGSFAVIDTQSWQQTPFQPTDAREELDNMTTGIFSADGGIAVRPVSARRLLIEHIDHPQPPRQIPEVGGDIAAYRVSPNGAYVGVAYRDHTFRLWHLASQMPLMVTHFTGTVPQVFFSKDTVGIVTFLAVMHIKFPTLDFEAPDSGQHMLGSKPQNAVKSLDVRKLTDEERAEFLD
jgi:WD40 repeat protein